MRRLRFSNIKENDLDCRVFSSFVPFQRAVGSRGRTGVDVELVFVLEGLELVRVPGDEDVHVQLSLQQRQAGHVAPGDHLVAVDEADLKLAHRHHLLLRVVQVLGGSEKTHQVYGKNPTRNIKLDQRGGTNNY